eukprot:1680155-Rhodomonas_salina.4
MSDITSHFALRQQKRDSVGCREACSRASMEQTVMCRASPPRGTSEKLERRAPEAKRLSVPVQFIHT